MRSDQSLSVVRLGTVEFDPNGAPITKNDLMAARATLDGNVPDDVFESLRALPNLSKGAKRFLNHIALRTKFVRQQL